MTTDKYDIRLGTLKPHKPILYRHLRLATALLMIPTPILFPQPAQSYSEQHLSATVRNTLVLPEASQPTFPDRSQEYQAMLAQKEAERIEAERQAALEAARQAELARQARYTATVSRSYSGAYQQVSGNTYTPGQCVWFVKNRKPQVPNGLGNASQWGYALGSSPTPAVGAIAWTTAGYAGHVAIVLQVSNGQVLIEEMNGAGGPFVVTQRWTPVSEFRYIYV